MMLRLRAWVWPGPVLLPPHFTFLTSFFGRSSALLLGGSHGFGGFMHSAGRWSAYISNLREDFGVLVCMNTDALRDDGMVSLILRSP